MPTTFRNLFARICGFEPLLHAYRRARRGKRSRPDVAAFEFRCEEHLHQLAEELAEGRYRPGAYRSFRITENGKARTISAAPFRDRVVHHALCAVLEPIWEPRFIHDQGFRVVWSIAPRGTGQQSVRLTGRRRGHNERERGVWPGWDTSPSARPGLGQ